jgi:hypothetical protein
VCAVVKPLPDFCRWVIDLIARGPPVEVNFTNRTRQKVTVGERFQYWTLEARANLLDPNTAKNGRLPNGAVSIPAGGNQPIRLRLPRGPAIQRHYRSDSGWLGLRFDVSAIIPTIERQQRWGKAVSDPFLLPIVDPNRWSSPPVNIYFCAKDYRNEPNRYMEDHSQWAAEAIAEKLGTFREVPDPNEFAVTVAVGCYKVNGPNQGEIWVSLHSDKIEPPYSLRPEPYETTADIFAVRNTLREEHAWTIAYHIRECVWTAYPLQGKVDSVEGNIVFLDIGRHAGVFKGAADDPLLKDRQEEQIFRVWRPPNKVEIARVKVWEVQLSKSSAEVIDHGKNGRIEAGCLVERYVGE